MDFMVAITTAVRRGAPNLYLVADMPFLPYQISKTDAIKNAGRFVTEAGAQMVKIEPTGTYLDVVKAVSDADIAITALKQRLSPKFAKSYGDLAQATIDAFNAYAKEVQIGRFPDAEHSYHIKSGELERLQQLLKG